MKRIFIAFLLLALTCPVSLLNAQTGEMEYININDSSFLNFEAWLELDRKLNIVEEGIDEVNRFELLNSLVCPDTIEAGFFAFGCHGQLCRNDVPKVWRDSVLTIQFTISNEDSIVYDYKVVFLLQALKISKKHIYYIPTAQKAIYTPGEYTFTIDCDGTQQHFVHPIHVYGEAIHLFNKLSFIENQDDTLQMSFYTAYPHTMTTEQLHALTMPYSLKQGETTIYQDTLLFTDVQELPEHSAINFSMTLYENMGELAAGDYTLTYIDPFTSEEKWVPINVQSTPTATENTHVDVTPIKAIENGQLVIIRDGKRYNLNGTEF